MLFYIAVLISYMLLSILLARPWHSESRTITSVDVRYSPSSSFMSSSLFFFSPDVHDGTMTDLAVSLTALNHSIFFYNYKGTLPAYTGLREKVITDKQYSFQDVKPKNPQILFPTKEVCKTYKLFSYNMQAVHRIWKLFRHNEVFQRVDAIICMFYPSECQNYIVFNKTVVFIPAHRFLIRRCSFSNSSSLIKWMFYQPKAPVIVMAAGRYDAEYLNYYSGRNVPFIISSTVLLYSPPSRYSPIWNEYLYAPFKKNIYYEQYQKMVIDACTEQNKPCSLVNIRERVKGRFKLSDINKFKAVIVFPYAVLSYYLADLVTTAIPMFVPSPSFIVKNGIAHDIKASDSHYCGAQFEEPPKHAKSKHPFSPEDHSEEATQYWLQYASYYTPCAVIFQNMTHLVNLMQTTNYTAVYYCNISYRQQILDHNNKEWSKLFRKIEKNRRMPNSIRESLAWYNESTFY